jgi:proteasome regulatory subunit
MERELNSIRIELERLRTPPLFSGSILELLDQGRVIVKSSTGPTFVVQVAGRIPTEELISGARVGLNQRSFAVMEVLPPSRDPLVRGMEVDERPDVSYGDIGGLDEQLLEIQETVELPLLQPELFEEVGVDPPKGVLLHGPPGTGKTLLARAVANETQATFIRVIGSELVQKYIGEGARLVREVFQFAREKGPSILFIDELDAIGSKRLDIATSGDREVQRTLMQLLSELDGFSPRGDVKVIGATNRIDILDVALLRAGRFDRHIEIPTPDSSARRAIFEIHSRPMNLSKDINYDILAGRTEGMSGADIKTICTEAGMFTIRDKRNMITHRDFLKAIEKLLQKRQQTEKAMNLYL